GMLQAEISCSPCSSLTAPNYMYLEPIPSCYLGFLHVYWFAGGLTRNPLLQHRVLLFVCDPQNFMD
ncbi:hypothetical protein L9F63_005225, partial [Diploptera punctata]